MRIAIIEDEALVAMEIEMHLQDAGHIVVGIADTLADAVALAERERPELALVDIQLSAGSNGLDVARAFNALDIVCLFATGNCPGADHDHAVGCLHKPYSGPQLLKAIGTAEAAAKGLRPQNIPSVMHLFQ